MNKIHHHISIRSRFIFYFAISLLFIFSSCKKVGLERQLLKEEGQWVIESQQIRMYENNGFLFIDTTFHYGNMEFFKHSRKQRKEYKKADQSNWDYTGSVNFEMMYPFETNIPANYGNGFRFDFSPTIGSYLWDVHQPYVVKKKMYFNNDNEIEVIENSKTKMVLEYDAAPMDGVVGGFNVNSIKIKLTLVR